jgi:cyanophycin synthetase
VLEVIGIEPDRDLLERWRGRVERARARLGWPGEAETGVVARVHSNGASLALAAPFDQLYTATEVNEWALCASLHERDPSHWGGLADALAAAAAEAGTHSPDAYPPEIEDGAALERLERLAAAERRPHLRALADAAQSRGLSFVLDDEVVSFGGGQGSRSYSLTALPFVADVPWDELHEVPTVLVTGSNGKTTTVRLVAACLRAAGRQVGLSCTDGLFVDATLLDAGDYSGPVGARTILRDPRVEAAVLETARGGVLRRGLAATRADVAVVTNVSTDHFGEYGIHDLDALADTKLTVASIVEPSGQLVLNADDPLLRRKAAGLHARFGPIPPLAWFARDADDEWLRQARSEGGVTCGVRNGHLLLCIDAGELDLGPIAAMPITLAGRAGYNVANLAAAALAARALGVEPRTIARAFAGFGVDPNDNAGRLMRFDRDGVQVLVDYAHNPEGLEALLGVAASLKGARGRVGMLLGHAGNREDADLERIAAVVARHRPDLVVVKELEGYLRGRSPGEVPRIIRAALLSHGLPDAATPVHASEVDAARFALDWARPGDVLLLLVHSLQAREAVIDMLR